MRINEPTIQRKLPTTSDRALNAWKKYLKDMGPEIKADIIDVLSGQRDKAKREGNKDCQNCAEKAKVEIAKLRRLLDLKPGEEQR